MNNILLLISMIFLFRLGCSAPHAVTSSHTKPLQESSIQALPNKEQRIRASTIKETVINCKTYDFGMNYGNIFVTCNDNSVLINLNGVKEDYFVCRLDENSDLSSWKKTKPMSYGHGNAYWEHKFFHGGLSPFDTVVSPEDQNKIIIPSNSWTLGERSWMDKACFIIDKDDEYSAIYLNSNRAIRKALIDLNRYPTNINILDVHVPDIDYLWRTKNRTFQNYAYNGTKVMFTNTGYLLYNWARDLLIHINYISDSVIYSCPSLQQCIASRYPGFKLHEMCVACCSGNLIIAIERPNADLTEKQVEFQLFSLSLDAQGMVSNTPTYLATVKISHSSWDPTYACSMEANSKAIYFSSYEQCVYYLPIDSIPNVPWVAK